ncbi:MAG: DUF3078 domain-containing protein, partial [Bacteroidia bacterium]|nr:DUF3078 domain-containing protein [Bacteroidia bacterium]
MKKSIFTLLSVVLTFGFVNAQGEAGAWIRKGDFGLQFTNAVFSTYQSSGNNNNANSLVGKFNYVINWKKDKHSWDNNLNLLYGTIRTTRVVSQGSSNTYQKALTKNGDLINFTTKYGYNLKKDLNFAILGAFQSQFAKGYKDPFADNREVISAFLAPGIVNLGMGLEYKPNDDFSIYYAPLNGRMTIVRIDSLRDNYSIVNPDGINKEFGSFLTAAYRKQVMTGIIYSTKIQLFTNYLKNKIDPTVNRPLSVDLQLWQHNLTFQVNKYI